MNQSALVVTGDDNLQKFLQSANSGSKVVFVRAPGAQTSSNLKFETAILNSRPIAPARTIPPPTIRISNPKTNTVPVLNVVNIGGTDVPIVKKSVGITQKQKSSVIFSQSTTNSGSNLNSSTVRDSKMLKAGQGANPDQVKMLMEKLIKVDKTVSEHVKENQKLKKQLSTSKKKVAKLTRQLGKAYSFLFN